MPQQPLDSRAHLGDGESAAREAGAVPPAAQDEFVNSLLEQIKELAPEAEVLHIEPGAKYLVLLPGSTETKMAQHMARGMQNCGAGGVLVRVNDPAAIRLFKL